MSREHLLLPFSLPATKPAETQYFCRLGIISKYFKTFFETKNSSFTSLSKVFFKKNKIVDFVLVPKAPEAAA